ncbi:hypothetical protein HKCCE4037_03435 [Rhodobacterales bacterium HKCCE4037]|nr:hypothetical protein [Rhodobacterales bacterium HKCCE4037]
MSFAQDLREHLPDGLILPDPIAEAMDWVEAQGWGGVYTHRDPDAFSSRYLSIYPPEVRDQLGASLVVFTYEAGPPLHEPPPEAMNRIATIASIAGDGGTLSLWRDNAGKQWFVVFNHGDPHVLTDDPLVALQFLAIGYSEPAALIDATLTPHEEARDVPIILPDAFRAFVEDRFDVQVPARASDLGITIPPNDARDPIRLWIDQIMPEPEIGSIPGMTAGNPYVITRDLRLALGDEGIAVLREAYEFVIEVE